jgi:hypothetical protein
VSSRLAAGGARTVCMEFRRASFCSRFPSVFSLRPMRDPAGASVLPLFYYGKRLLGNRFLL